MPDRADLLDRHTPALRRYAWALCRSTHDADDLVQDCLERALSRWHLRRDESGVRAWLFTILHNAFVDGYRSAQRRGPHGPIEDAHELGQDAGQDAAMAVRDVATALQALPEDQRAVVLLVGVEDLSYEEAARVLGIPIGTVMSRLGRGRERLRRMTEAGQVPQNGLRRVK